MDFEDPAPALTGGPGYHPAALLKLFIYLDRIKSSRRLEREAGRNFEVWLQRQLAPDDNTIAVFVATTARR